MKNQSEVKKRQMDLGEQYRSDPSLALITHSSEVSGTNFHDPFKTSVTISDDLLVPFDVGIHKAVGGNQDFPNPSDLLCAALSSCFESTVRLIADRLGIQLTETRVTATAFVDVRGTLMIDKTVSVGYQYMRLDVVLVSDAPNQKVMNVLLRAAEQSCIVYQTISRGTTINLNASFNATEKVKSSVAQIS